ncbi:MAG TPA: cytochrome c oxidase assembly protein [Methylovirgula sp.]|nr:cytochrome c oxidase assembly protein [Methylovirgula sp.]
MAQGSFSNKWVAVAVLLATASMLGLSFAAVPLYRLFCARTGFAGTTQVAHVAPTTRGKRQVIVRFDTNVGAGLAWRFEPEIAQVTLLTGQTATVFFKVTNLTDQETAARAVYNVSPGQSGAYFDKISCFCFNTQHLGPHQMAEMPVVFFLDPALEKDETMNGIDEITLSYTFYSADASKQTAAGENGSKNRL